MSDEIKREEEEFTLQSEIKEEMQEEVIGEEIEKKESKPLAEIYAENKIRKRKITLISILSVVFVLVVAIIVMGCVKVDLRPSFFTKPSQVTIYGENNTSVVIADSDDRYKDFERIYNDMFSTSVLSALFTGRLGGYTIDEGATKNDYWYTNSNETTFSSTITEALGSNYVRLHFDSPMKFYNANGSEYVSKYNDSYSLTFQDVYFAIDNVNATDTFTFYFQVKGNTTTNPQRTTITTITLSANTSQLFEEFLGK